MDSQDCWTDCLSPSISEQGCGSETYFYASTLSEPKDNIDSKYMTAEFESESGKYPGRLFRMRTDVHCSRFQGGLRHTLGFRVMSRLSALPGE